jgi:hypothetical protein
MAATAILPKDSCNYFSASRAADNHEWLQLLVCLAWYILMLEKGVLARSEKGS